MTGDIRDETLSRRIQIRETIKAHFDKEMELFDKGVKVPVRFLSTKAFDTGTILLPMKRRVRKNL